MNESRSGEWMEGLRLLMRACSLGAFALIVGFWLTAAFYLVRGLFRGGVHEAGLWLLQIGQRLWDPPGLYREARWDLVAARFSAIGVLSILLWLVNRRAIMRIVEGWCRNAQQRASDPLVEGSEERARH
jgi:hypothetical protein